MILARRGNYARGRLSAPLQDMEPQPAAYPGGTGGLAPSGGEGPEPPAAGPAGSADRADVFRWTEMRQGQTGREEPAVSGRQKPESASQVAQPAEGGMAGRPGAGGWDIGGSCGAAVSRGIVGMAIRAGGLKGWNWESRNRKAECAAVSCPGCAWLVARGGGQRKFIVPDALRLAYRCRDRVGDGEQLIVGLFDGEFNSQPVKQLFTHWLPQVVENLCSRWPRFGPDAIWPDV